MLHAPFCFSRLRRNVSTLTILLGLLAILGRADVASGATPVVGGTAPNFTLQTLDDQPVELKQVLAKGPVVLVMLRGWPGYQCPICALQVHDYVAHAPDFAKLQVQVVFVYPGPSDQLKAHAEEFLKDKQWPTNFIFVIDPDYTFTNAYGLRWDAQKETAHPSTFVVERTGLVRFAHVSSTHGNRVGAAEALAQFK